MLYQEILTFWFDESKPSQWFAKSENFDQLIIQRFSTVHRQVSQGEMADWRQTIEGRLAEIIVLDQFSRNMFRNDPRSFASDGMALVLAQEALASGDVHQLPVAHRVFLYMPFMHSESLVIHEQALALFSEQGLEENLKFEKQHRDILLRFGRYPHRNAVLGRVSTAEEIEFLQEPGSSF